MSRMTTPERAAAGRTPVNGANGARPSARTPAKPPRPLNERPTRWQLLRRRQRWLLRPIAWGIVGVALLAGVANLVRTMQPGHSIASLRERIAAGTSLLVRDIVVEGRSLTPEPVLRAALGVSKGDKLLGFSLDAARARIERLTWVQHATVERRLPGTVVVQLVERRPFAVWQTGDRFVLIDRAGQVVAEQDPVKDAAAFATLPLVVGPGAPEFAAALLDQLALQPSLRSRVVAAIRVGERRWNLRLNNGADVLLPEGAEAAAMRRLMELHGTQALLDRPLQTLDLRLPDRMVVRAQPEAHGPIPSSPIPPSTIPPSTVSPSAGPSNPHRPG
jgi:cell division protein FtsQ